MAGLSHFTTRDASGHKRYEREGLVDWAAQRFHVDLDLEDLKNRQRDEIRDLLVEHSRKYARHSRRSEVRSAVALEAGLQRPVAHVEGTRRGTATMAG